MRLLKLLAQGLSVEDTYLYKGGKGMMPAPQPIVAPTAPVEEASVEIEEDDAKKKLKTGKSSLKMPIKTTTDTGLKV